MNPTYQAVMYALDSASNAVSFFKSLSDSGLKATEVNTALRSQKVWIVQLKSAVNMLDAQVAVRQNGNNFKITQISSDKSLNELVKSIIEAYENSHIATLSSKAREKHDNGAFVTKFRVLPSSVSSKKIGDIENGKIAKVTGELAQGGMFNGYLSVKRMTGQRSNQFDVLLKIEGVQKPVKFGIAREDMTIKELSDYLAIDDKETKIDFSIIAS
jgi:hypothetical protein